MNNVKVCVIRAAGTNCDRETAYAFESAGAQVEVIHINEFVAGRKALEDFYILAIPGGFTYGDDVASGKILANQIRQHLLDGVRKFIADGKLIIGICNGFQVLVKSGLLPDISGKTTLEASLILNDCGKFEDRWVYLKNSSSKCVWTAGIAGQVYYPIAHAEGKFVAEDEKIIAALKNNDQIVFQYCDKDGGFGGFPVNPNGSVEHIAGICDTTGRILGMMPHPERHINSYQHPSWGFNNKSGEGDGFIIFKNGVDYVKKEFFGVVSK